MPQLCNCGTQFTVDHAMICHMGGFPTIHHNEIRDITASLLTEVCHNVATEPALQQLTGERMVARTAKSDEGARLDIRARGFWNRAQDAFFDIRVFYPNASSNRSSEPSSAYRRHEQAKKCEYGQRVREIEKGVYIYTTCTLHNRWHGKGGHNLLQVTSRHDHLKTSTLLLSGDGLAKVSTSFCIASVMCIQGSRSSLLCPVFGSNILLATSEGRVPLCSHITHIIFFENSCFIFFVFT